MTQLPRASRVGATAVPARSAHDWRVPVTPRSLVLVVVVPALSVPAVTRAQQAPPPRVRREIPGFDFRKDGVWRRQARAVRAQRARLLSRGNFGALNAPRAAVGAPLGSGPAVSGVLRVPAVLFRFKDTRSEEHTSELQSRLHLVCRLLLEKKKKKKENNRRTKQKKHVVAISVRAHE